MSLERLQKAHALMIQIVARNPDGRRLVPIVTRLEAAIADHASIEADYERILKMAADGRASRA
jgi:hypothetical protein